MSDDVTKLKEEESRIWNELDDVCEEDTLKSIARLIEVNLLLEKECNQ